MLRIELLFMTFFLVRDNSLLKPRKGLKYLHILNSGETQSWPVFKKTNDKNI